MATYFGLIDNNGAAQYFDTGSGAGTTASPYCGKVTFLGDGVNQFKTGSNANLAAFSAANSQLCVQPGNWTKFHAPAINTQATISKGAVASTLHVCTSVSGTVGSNATGGTPGIVTINLRDSTTGAGNILMSWTLWCDTIANQVTPFNFGPFNIPGVSGQALTLESAAGPGAQNFVSVAMTGYSSL